MPTDEDCKICLTEATKTLNELESLTKNSILKMNNEQARSLEERGKRADQFFETQEMKHDNFLDKQDKRENIKLIRDIFILGIFATAIGTSYIKQENILNDLAKKAEVKEVPSMNEIRMLRELGDEYNRTVFERKKQIKGDTSAYYFAKKAIYGSELRGSKSIKN
jgi:hypothetical protein